MTVKEFYDAICGDYDETLGRLAKEERMEKYLRKFTENTDYNDFIKAYQNQSFSDAFRFVHNIKGMSLNLGLTKLSDISSKVCDELRSGTPTGNIKEDVVILSNVYNETIEIIKKAFNV